MPQLKPKCDSALTFLTYSQGIIMNKSNVSHTKQQIPTIEVTSFDCQAILSDIKEKASSFPKMFQNLPIIIDLSKLADESGLNAPKQIIVKLAEELISGLKVMKLNPIGFIGLDKEDCATLKLAHFNNEIEKETDAVVTENTNKQNTICKSTIVHNGDFRSGMTIYEEDANLVIIGDVKRGSEVAAGGNVIVFGKLLGKAHAGTKFPDSVVLTTELDPEIVSIGGIFLANQNFSEKDLNKTALITIDEQHKLVVSSC